MMVFRRFGNKRGNSLRPIHRIKHVVDQQLGLVLNVAQTFQLVTTVDAPVIANTTEVETGSSVNGIYLNVEGYATTAGALANIYMIITKNPGNNIGFPNGNAVGTSDNKRFVIHQEMKMLEQSVNGNPRTIFNGVVAIPREYRRMAPDDRLQIQLFTPGVNASVCFQCHYKEFR